MYHVGERTQGWRERYIKTFKEKHSIFRISSLCQFLSYLGGSLDINIKRTVK